ncbi:MAG: MoaD/ThiS family protein [Planctomycetales bacterium]|nr:MoaD/ThiS family protein [Planctomycetales bacterium]
MRIHLSSHLRDYTGGKATVEAGGKTLSDVVDALEARFPGLRFRIVDEQGGIRPHIRFFVGEEAAPDLSVPVPPGAEVHILGALSGG